MTDLQKIILLENDVSLARTLRDGLKETFPKVQVIFDVPAVAAEIESFAPDVLLADCSALGGRSVPAFCRDMRALTDVPLLLFSARVLPLDKARALDAGADDFLDKPPDLRELTARIRAVWRRFHAQPLTRQARPAQKYVEYPGLIVSLSNYTVIYNGRNISMPPRELELLYFLAKTPNRVFTREQLLDQIWGYDFVGDARTVDVHIKRIRKKIKDQEGWSIDTVWGVGYKFSTAPSYISSDDPPSAADQTDSV